MTEPSDATLLRGTPTVRGGTAPIPVVDGFPPFSGCSYFTILSTIAAVTAVTTRTIRPDPMARKAWSRAAVHRG